MQIVGIQQRTTGRCHQLQKKTATRCGKPFTNAQCYVRSTGGTTAILTFTLQNGFRILPCWEERLHLRLPLRHLTKPAMFYPAFFKPVFLHMSKNLSCISDHSSGAAPDSTPPNPLPSTAVSIFLRENYMCLRTGSYSSLSRKRNIKTSSTPITHASVHSLSNFGKTISCTSLYRISFLLDLGSNSIEHP